MTPEQICSTYRAWDILTRRWLATWLDLLFLGALLWGLVTLTGGQAALSGSLGLLLLALYYPLTEGLFGRTFGKLVCGLRVVDERGALPGIGKATVRTLVRAVEINPLLMGGLPAAYSVFSSQARQRFGDRAAHTFVLKTEDLPLLSAPGAMGTPAIQEFSLPMGTPLAVPASPGAFGAPQRLPTHNRFWALPAAFLLTGATAVLILAVGQATEAQKRVHPVTMTASQFLSAPPEKGWYQLKGCDYLIQDALYTNPEGDAGDSNAPTDTPAAEIGDIYVPVFATPDNEGKKTPLLVKVTDDSTRKLLVELNALDTKDKKKTTSWLNQHFAQLAVHRDITGTLATEISIPDSIQKHATEDKDSRLKLPFRVLTEGETPADWGSGVAIAGAVASGMIAALAWLLALVALAGGGAPPPTYSVYR